MMRFISIPVVLIFLTPTLKSQPVTYLNVEAGPQWSLIKVSDPGQVFRNTNAISSLAGLTVSQEFRENTFFSTGIYFQPYRDGINMDDKRPQPAIWSSYNALLFPFRLEYRREIPEYPVSITPRIGYVFGLVSYPSEFEIGSGVIGSPDGVSYLYSIQQSFSTENLHLLEVGLSIGLRFWGLYEGAISLSYLSGFTDPATTDIVYSTGTAPATTATYSTHGNTLYSTLSFHFPFSNIWQNRDYRIRARIEHSTFDVKSLDKRGEFYVGGDLGPLWRQFFQTNPAIGARPLQGRGLFRYANFHGGIYGGYMFTEELGIDLGAYYQRSSTFYAVMVDHEVDFTTKTRAPMYLEIPVRIRYQYNVYKKRIFYVVYGGASLLTSFATDATGSGSGSFTYTSPVTGNSLDGTTSYEASRTSHFRPGMRIGTGAEYLVPVGFPLVATFYVSYLHGFISSENIQVTNTLQDADSEGGIIYNGSGWYVDFGAKIPFRLNGKGRCGRLPTKEDLL